MCLDIGKWQKRHQQFVQIFTLRADATSGAAWTLAHLSPRGHKSNPPSSVRPRLKALKSASCCWVSTQAAIFSATSFSSSNPLLCSIKSLKLTDDLKKNRLKEKMSRKGNKQTEAVELRVGSELVGSKGVYIVKEFLGEGGFGKVAKCSKLWSLEYYAVKIMKISREGQKEFETMKLIQDLDPDENHLIKMYECFTYRKMTCIVYELLEVNFHDSLMNEQQLVPLCYIRVIAQQLLKALKALKSIGVAHCDIKLDNIMFKDLDDMNVKLIDFGLAVETNEILTGTKMQVTQFRAPEVILGLPLDESVDMWALGMVLACVYCGYYLFLSSTEYETIRAMVHIFGLPEADVLHRANYKDAFFTRDNGDWRLCTPEEYTEITGNRVRYMNPVIDFDAMTDKHRNMYEMHDDDDHKAFIDLLKRMLEVNPQHRITPSQALEHDFITMKHLAGKSKALGRKKKNLSSDKHGS
uniref:Protein kinase domain-containing protein n=1 Tax=Oryzias latipes TaxID=8090 RepID=A0A3P9J7S4_ORYLA